MAKVVAYKDRDTGELESVDSMLKRFKKRVLDDNILGECKKREYFVKKSLARKLKSIENQKRIKMRQAKNRKRNSK